MNCLRVLIQNKLEEIQELNTTPEIPDDVLEKGKTYFSYTLQKNFVNSDCDKNFTYRINLTGYIKRLNNNEEDTLKIVDDISLGMEKKLKDLNIKTSYEDVSLLDNIRKIRVTGEFMFNEINNGIG